MSRRRVLAIGAVVAVPVVVLAIVLASVLGGDDGGDHARSPAAVSPDGAVKPRPSAPADSTAPGTGGVRSPAGELRLLDRGATPPALEKKLAPASTDGTLALDELRGTPIVLNVWSADCAPCRGEARVLQSEWERLGNRGVLFLGLNVLDSPTAARRFREQYDLTYPSVGQQRAETARSLGATGVPETFFLSKDGRVVGHVKGAVSLGQLEIGIRAAQTDRATPTEEGGGQIPLR